MSKLIKNYIPEILNKYWEGETTLMEEKELLAFFTENDDESIPIEYRVYKPFFLAKAESNEPKLSEDFDVKLLNSIKVEDSKQVELKSIMEKAERQSQEIRQLRWFAGIAASIAILLFAYISFDGTNTVKISQINKKESPLTDTQKKEAMKAYKQTEAALFFVSLKMQQGTQKATKSLNKLKGIEKMLEDVE